MRRLLALLRSDDGAPTTAPQPGLANVDDLVATKEWNEYNYTNAAAQDPRYRGDDGALSALAEGLGWLRNRGLIARSAAKTADASIFVTRAGHAALPIDADLPVLLQ